MILWYSTTVNKKVRQIGKSHYLLLVNKAAADRDKHLSDQTWVVQAAATFIKELAQCYFGTIIYL